MSIPVAAIESETESRIKRLARTVKMSGFRPGKVPVKMVASTYGPQVRSEVLSDEVNKTLAQWSRRTSFALPDIRVRTEGRRSRRDEFPVHCDV